MGQKYKKLVKPGLLLLILLLLSGCNNSLVIRDFKINSPQYKQKGHFLPKRRVGVSVEVDSIKDETLDYTWTANGGQILAQNGAEITYLTPNVPGKYKMFLTVKNKSGDQIQHEFSFAVKGNYPAKVSLDDLKTTSVKSGIKLAWSQYSKDDFYTYKILRSNNNFIDSEAKVIATINDKEQSSYVDTKIEAKEVYSYQIMVINKAGYLSISNEKMIETLPQEITKISLQGELSDLVVGGAESELYLNNKAENKLLILDSATQELKKEIKWEFGVNKLFLNKANNYLFALGTNKKTLLRLDLNNYTQQEYSFAAEIKDISLVKDEIYLALGGEHNLVKFDITDGLIKERLKVTHNGILVNPSQIDILADQYLFLDKVFGESLVYHLTNLTDPISQFDIGIVKNSTFCKIGDEDCLYVANTHHPLQVYAGVKSGQVKLKKKFDEISTPKDFAIDEERKRIFAAVDKKIYIYSLEHNQLLNKIQLDSYVKRLAWGQNEDKLYLLTSQINQQNYNLMIANLKQLSGEDRT